MYKATFYDDIQERAKLLTNPDYINLIRDITRFIYNENVLFVFYFRLNPYNALNYYQINIKRSYKL